MLALDPAILLNLFMYIFLHIKSLLYHSSHLAYRFFMRINNNSFVIWESFRLPQLQHLSPVVQTLWVLSECHCWASWLVRMSRCFSTVTSVRTQGWRIGGLYPLERYEIQLVYKCSTRNSKFWQCNCLPHCFGCHLSCTALGPSPHFVFSYIDITE